MLKAKLLLQLVTVSVWLGTCSPAVPASFVFGDSLVDVGNNNYFISLARADCPPNGIDFGRPTGRFTNGRTIPDIVGQEIGLNGFTPPYLAPTTNGPVVLRGVNYASGGAGILNSTAILALGRINFDAQLDDFANTRESIITMLGASAAANLLKNALFSVTIGSNDFINNYLTPVVSIPKQQLVSPGTFIGTLISRYRLQLTRLYKMGARKIIVVNVGPIGCMPYQRELNPLAGDGCAAFPNQLAQLFNHQLRGLVKELRANLEGSKFVYADVYHIGEDMIQNLASYGLENADYACCHVAGRYGGLVPCGPASKFCSDRSKYFFWDPYHPTDAVNTVIAKRLMEGDLNDIWPMNIRQLVSS